MGTYPKVLIGLIVLLLVAPTQLEASEVMKIADDRYLLTDQSTTSFSGTGSMKRKVYRLSASLCVGLEFSWMLPIDQEAGGGSFWGDSNPAASMEVLYFRNEEEARAKAERLQGGMEPVECAPLANEKNTRKLLNKLRKRGEL